MKRIYLLSCLCFIIMKSNGQLLNEPFNYTPDPVLGLNVQSANQWRIVNTGDSILVDASSLTYPGLASSTGNKVKFDGVGTDYYTFFPSQTTGSVYRSFILNVSALGGMNTTGSYFNAFIQSGSTTVYGGAVWTRLSTTPGKFNLGFSTRSNSVVTWLPTDLTPGTPCFIVIAYVFNAGAGDDVARIWLNTSAIGGAEPAPDATSAPGTDLTSAERILLRQESVTTTPFIEFDELRVGTTWAQVTPSSAIPSLGVSPSSLSFAPQAVGTQSASQFFNLSGSNLTGAPGNITVNSTSTDFQVSNDNSTWGASTTIAYASATLSATPVYVRFTPLTGGPKSGNVTFSGGGVAVPPTVALTGTGIKTYYSKSSGTLTNISNWGDVSDGTGTTPPDFSTDGQIFTVANRVTETLDANWIVSGAGSKVVVGNGIAATELIIPSGFTLTGTVDVANLGTLTLQNTTLPTLGTFSTGSTVNFAQAGTLIVPAGTYYHLRLTNGTKTLATGITTVNGNFVIDAVTGFNGAGSPFSTVNLAGNFTMQNAAAFDPDPAGDGNRLTLILTGSGTQTLSGGNFYLFRLQTPAAPATTLNIVLSSANLYLGNASSGGLNLQQAAHTLSLNGNTLNIQKSGFFGPVNVGTIIGTATSSVYINKTSGGTAIGSVGFAAGGQVLDVFSFMSSGTGGNNLTLNSPLRVMNGFALGAGNLITTTTNMLTLDANCIPFGASATAFVSGPMTMETNFQTTYTFTVGKGSSYRPVDVIPSTAAASSYTAEYFNTAYSDFTLCSPNLDAVANNEYWDIARNSGSPAQVRLNYMATNTWSNAGTPDATKAIVVAHFVAACWKEENGTFLPGTSGPAPVTSKTLATFSPFGFGFGPLAILPVNFDNIKAYQQAGNIRIEWSNLTETDVLNYSIERSADGRTFTTIGSVNARLNNGSRADYSFIDLSPLHPVNYYRINVKRNNASSKYSIIVKVDMKSNGTGITIYPNPVMDRQISLQATGLVKGQYTIRIFDATGRQVLNKLLNHNGGAITEVIQLPATIDKGVYSIQLSGGEVKLSKTFIVQ